MERENEMNRTKRSGQLSPQQAITILVVISVLAAVALFTFAIPTLQRYLALKDAEPIQTAEADLDEISTDGLYCIDDATVLDGYCYTGDSAEDASDFSYVILFFTGDDQLVAASLTVTPEDDARIREIAREQFQNWDRIFGRNPKFTIDRIGRFAGGKIQFKLDVQKGIIQDAAVYGDFFSTLDASTICNALIGCPYERDAVLSALRNHGIDGAVYRISAEEMAAAAVD